jgi:flagellar assembly protein FliH
VSYVLIAPKTPDAPVVVAAPDPALHAAEVAAQVAREVALLRAEAQAQGRAEGEAAGRAAQEALAAAALAPAVAALQESCAQLAAPLAQQQEALAGLVTDLAFSLCRHILGVEVKTNAAALTALVTRLIAEAAAERQARQSIVIRVNPQDQAWLQPVMAIENAHLLGDAAISRGGAMVELIAPDGDPVDKIEWDATLETRLAAVQEALGLAQGAAG